MSKTSFSNPKSIPDGQEDIGSVLLKRENVISPQDETDLFDQYVASI
jgi:hypothetical protein